MYIKGKFKNWRIGLVSRAQSQVESVVKPFGVDITDSNAGRIGKGLVGLAIGIHLVTPVLFVLGLLVVSAVPALAQTPSGGGIFGANDQTTGRGIIEFIKWFRNLIFLAGIAFFMWAGINMGFEKPWGTKAIAGVACWGFAGLASLAYSFSQGNAVNLDTDLGN